MAVDPPGRWGSEWPHHGLFPSDVAGRAVSCATRSDGYGTRLVVELFASEGSQLATFALGGGLTKNAFLLQICAEVLGLPTEVAPAGQPSAHGAAILAAVAGDAHRTVADGIAQMSASPASTTLPHGVSSRPYGELYSEYSRLVDLLGRAEHSPIKRLRTMSRASGVQVS